MDNTVIDPQARGVEVSWSYGFFDATSVRIPRETFRAIVARNGFDSELVRDITPTVALRRAMKVARGRTREVVLQYIISPNPDTPKALGVYYVTPSVTGGEEGDDVQLGARVRVENGAVVAYPPEGASEYPNDAARLVALQIEGHANRMMTHVYNAEISSVLHDIGYGDVRWINRRRTSGGVYLLLNDSRAESFVRLLRDIERETHHQHPKSPSRHFYPEMMEIFPRPLSDSMYAAAAHTHFESALRALVANLEQKRDSKRIRSIVENGAEELDRLLAEAARYEDLLNGYGSRIASALSDVRSNIKGMLDSDDFSKTFDFIDALAAE